MSNTAPNHRQATVQAFDDENDLFRVGIVGDLAAPPVGTDAITALYPNSTTEIFQYRVGGSSGTILRTVTVVYTDTSKNDLLSLEVS